MRILFVINDGNFFLSHRLALAKAAHENGHDIYVACPDSAATSEILKHGFSFQSITLSRRGMNPLAELKLIGELRDLYKSIQPDMIHHFSIKPIIYGSIAANFLDNILVINTPTGLGYVVSNTSFKAKCVRWVVMKLYRIAMLNRNISMVFQNPDDKHEFDRLGFNRQKETFIVRGAGVDPNEYHQSNENEPGITVVFPARLLWDKGLQEFIDAATLLKISGVNARFVLVGDVDPGNPATVSKRQLDSWVSDGVVEWWGWQTNMVDVFHRSHIVCLPSYREGVPKALLEAAACGRPIVTTDAPGCREVVLDGYNGYLVPIKDSNILAERLNRLISDPPLRQVFGNNGRKRVEQEFTATKIAREMMQIYQYLLSKSQREG